GCNMRCEGFGCVEVAPDGREILGCDTVYAVDKKAFGASWQSLETTEELIGIFDSYQLPSDVDIVLTGGEPLLHADNPILIAFLEFLISRHHCVTFETNGAVAVDFERYPVYKSCIYALSVKLSNSGEAYEKRVRPEIFNAIIDSADESFFKFTVDEESLVSGLSTEIETVLSLAHKTEVTCMPKGGSKEEVEANTQAVIEYCKRQGFRYSDRLHIRIWDQNKGV
ncbi:MAG: 7-carboxy-7-deazaguanine synthase QueE, partial [Campylobacterota bacterium]|nr:7-carboxy-7-deazaguanine synthase QueE [Campylobacterota bacterium]